MQNRKLNIRALLFGLLMLALAFPWFQHLFPLYKSEPLAGDVRPAPDASFSLEAWMSGSFQYGKEKHLNDNIGARPELVRINNQIDYMLFRKLHASGVVIGRDYYMYEDGYIKAYNGTDFMGMERIMDQLGKLRFIQDTLARAGKQLLLTFVPSKGRFYPEYFPASMQQHAPAASNYSVMREACARLGINHLDLNGWFRNMKATAPHPLFSKQGIHWTHLGAAIAADSFNRHLEQMLGIDIPDLTIGRVECTDSLRGENDIARGLNLLVPLTRERLCYAKTSFTADSNRHKRPAVIFICDSFFWTFLDLKVPQHCYRNWHMWYYFSEDWNERVMSGKADMQDPKESDWLATVSGSDAVVLFISEPNLANLGWTFIDRAYKSYGGR
jgi:hypothetical protein